MLTYSDVVKLFPNVMGIEGLKLNFHTIAFNSTITQEKGLFIASALDTNLAKAIENGAVASIWPEEIPLPTYRPNHFPVILVKCSLKALEVIVREYSKKITLKKCGELTNMIIFKQDLQNEEIYSEIQLLLQEMDVKTGKGRESK